MLQVHNTGLRRPAMRLAQMCLGLAVRGPKKKTATPGGRDRRLQMPDAGRRKRQTQVRGSVREEKDSRRGSGPLREEKVPGIPYLP